MTSKQLEEKRGEIRARGYGWINGAYIEPPADIALELKKIDCIDMINSVLAYPCQGMTNADDVLTYEEKSYFNYLKEYIDKLGRDVVRALIQEQINDIVRVVSMYIDGRGYYNSIVWRDEA